MKLKLSYCGWQLRWYYPLEDGAVITKFVNFDGTTEWQRSATELDPGDKKIKSVTVTPSFKGNYAGSVDFDDIRIQKGKVLTNYEYDSKNNYINSTTDLLGRKTSTTYSEVGNKLTETDGKGYVTSFNYDKVNRLISTVVPGYDVKVVYGYDKNGNQTSKTFRSKDDSITYSNYEYRYNEANELKKIIDPLNHVTQFDYDLNGNQETITNPDQTKVGFAYDKLNQLTNISYNGVEKYRFGYVENANQTNILNTETGETTENSFDSLDRKESQSITNKGSVNW